MLKKILFSIIFMAGGIFAMYFGLSNKSLVVNQGKVYSKTTAPFGLGIKLSSQAFLGNLPENTYAKCEVERSRKNSKTTTGYKLKLMSQNSSRGITANSYGGSAVCRNDANVINDLIKYEKNFTYNFPKTLNSYIAFLVGFIFFVIGIILPFGKNVTLEELNTKKVFSRDLTAEEFEAFKKTGQLPPDLNEEAMKKSKDFLDKHADVLASMEASAQKVNNIMNVLKMFKTK